MEVKGKLEGGSQRRGETQKGGNRHLGEKLKRKEKNYTTERHLIKFLLIIFKT